MTDPSSVLATIDGAIEAWETSPDAMRWAPAGADDPLNPPPAVRQRLEAEEIERLRRAWTRRQQEGPEPRRPVTDRWRPGTRLVPFVGGPFHCDLRAIPLPLPWTYHAPIPTPLVAYDISDPYPEVMDLPPVAIYNLTSAMAPQLGSSPFQVYRMPRATDRELSEAIYWVHREGHWRP